MAFSLNAWAVRDLNSRPIALPKKKNLTTNTMKKKIKNTQLFDNCHRSTPELTALVPLRPHRLDG